jgi:hypothetical protein
MAAIAYSAVNRAAYLQDHPKTKLNFFGATARSLPGVINVGQYGSVGDANFLQAKNPSTINTSTGSGAAACEFLKNAISAAEGVLDGTIADPFDSSGGTFGLRTAGHAGPGGSYFKFSNQLPGSGNNFYGIP